MPWSKDMADNMVKDINPNIGTYNNGDALNSQSVAVKDINSDALLVAWQTGG